MLTRSACGATPAITRPLRAAPIVPATSVPWPSFVLVDGVDAARVLARPVVDARLGVVDREVQAQGPDRSWRDVGMASSTPVSMVRREGRGCPGGGHRRPTASRR